MDAILKLFHDPTWWFTAVLIGTCASVLAGYVKDWLSSGMASLSARYTARRAARVAEFKRQAKYISSDINFIIDTRIKLVGVTVLWCFSGVMALGLYILSDLKLDSKLPLGPSIGIFGFLALYGQKRSDHLADLANEAMRLYKEKCQSQPEV